MFVQALAEYADAKLQSQLQDLAFETKPVAYSLEISNAGKFLAVVERAGEAVIPAKSAKGLSKVLKTVLSMEGIPRSPVNRNSGLHPLLACDDIKYVLGPGAWTKSGEEENHRERFEAFVELLRLASQTVADPALAACVAFYANPAEVAKARAELAAAKPGSMVALSVSGQCVIQLPAVAAWWRQHYLAASAGRAETAEQAECMLTGRFGPIAPTHEKIKHTAGIGGQSSGVALMSFDKPAFRSYGWEQCGNSPVSPERAMAYVLALNDMLKPGSGRRTDFGNTAYIYWLRHPGDDAALLFAPKPEQVEALLRDLQHPANPGPNMFYMAALSATGARLIVRSWIEETLPEVKANIVQWYFGLRVQPLSADARPATPSWDRLRYALAPPVKDTKTGTKKAKVTDEVNTALVMRRLLGRKRRPLGYSILNAVLTRMRTDLGEEVASKTGGQARRFPKREDAAAAGLLRLCLNDILGEDTMTEAMNPGERHPGYLCGRLLAVYEGLQWQASQTGTGDEKSDGVNVTVADRYFRLASVQPNLAFTRMEALARAHLAKIRRRKPGLHVNLLKQIAELHELISAGAGQKYPKQLDLDGQGRFALGFYHQLALRFRNKTDDGAEQEPEVNTERNDL